MAIPRSDCLPPACRRPVVLAALGLMLGALVSAGPAAAEPRAAIAMHGEPLYKPGFTHFAYANPDAPKGGRLTRGVLGSFDSLNPFIVRGNAASGLRGGIADDNVYESLMVRGYDEPFTLYALVADSVDVPDDRSRVTFQIDPRAHFSDGVPITPEDVIFSFNLLKEHGYPSFKANYADVAEVSRVGDRGVLFAFKGEANRELPLILGLMPILPKHSTDPASFESTTLERPIGSGPYVVADVDAGRRVTLKRDPNYWGKDLAVRRGLYNFDEIRYDYYRDATNLFEAFKKGDIDLVEEADPAHWSQAYDFPALAEGRVVKEAFRSGLPKPMTGFAMNARRPPFDDRRVRQALVRLFDFEWANKNLYYGLYARTGSYFQGSDLSSLGVAASETEKTLLAAEPGAVAPEFLVGTWRPPQTDGSGRDRVALKAGLDLLIAAGFKLDGGQLKAGTTGKPFSFEILTQTREQEHVALGYQRTLKMVGIEASVRTVDAAEYDKRRKTFDFDMTMWTWASSLSPGNEQRHRWTSEAAGREGSYNLPGVKSPAADRAIEALVGARTRDDLAAGARALDRVLLSGYYVVPLFHLPEQWIAHWARIDHPKAVSLFGAVTPAWWERPGDLK
ncbi:MAG: extracellular solute-binding protein [Ancalomicrobiaceae bacterium]|nr:extracellular solute-binding protein [Ancalomicrobiaceae bacterium]